MGSVPFTLKHQALWLPLRRSSRLTVPSLLLRGSPGPPLPASGRPKLEHGSPLEDGSHLAASRTGAAPRLQVEARSLLFRSLNVRRLYDKESNTIVYVSYSTRLDKNDDENKSRFKTSMCAVPVR